MYAYEYEIYIYMDACMYIYTISDILWICNVCMYVCMCCMTLSRNSAVPFDSLDVFHLLDGLHNLNGCLGGRHN